MPVGPWPAPDDLFDFLADASAREGWRPMAIVDRVSGRAAGMAAYMRIRAAHGVAEIGCVGSVTYKTPKSLSAGTYTYFCRIHPFMRGSFRVVPKKHVRG